MSQDCDNSYLEPLDSDAAASGLRRCHAGLVPFVDFPAFNLQGLPFAPWICTLRHQDEHDATAEPAPKDETTKGDAGKKVP